jgi:Protein of unknown function (DUF3300)
MSRQWLAIALAICMIDPGWSVSLAQPAPTPIQQTAGADQFDPQQLDSLLAPIALYPDQLLTQILMAATFPLQIVEASRWIEDQSHKGLSGDALEKALQPLSWDPSVKSLVPFPQVLSQLNANLDWTQQLGYAFGNQQKDVLASVQRLRRQAHVQGHLQTTTQQVVKVEAAPAGAPPTQQTIVIEPAQPNVVYVPSYNPTVVYGAWPYPAYPPVVAAPAPGYVVGTALAAGLAFGAGVAITGALWGWGQPNWYGGNVNVNVNRWNNINVHNNVRMNNGNWNANLNRPLGRPANLQRPPSGPVGRPVRNAGLPANAIGRPNVSVPGSAVNRPARTNGGNFSGANRPNGGNLSGANRPKLSPGSRPNPPAANRQFNPPQNRAGAGGAGQRNFQRPQGGGAQQRGNAFGGAGNGRQAQSWGNRGAQSRQISRPAGGGFHGRRR